MKPNDQELKAAEAEKEISLLEIKRTFMQKAIRRLANISGVTEQIAIETCKQAGYQMREFHYWWTNLPAVGEAFKLYSEWLIKGWWGPYGSGNMQIRGEVMRQYARANPPELPEDCEILRLEAIEGAQQHKNNPDAEYSEDEKIVAVDGYITGYEDCAIRYIKSLAAKDRALTEALEKIAEREEEIELMRNQIIATMAFMHSNPIDSNAATVLDCLSMAISKKTGGNDRHK